MTQNPNENQVDYPILVIKEKGSGEVWALPVVRKGNNGDDLIINRVSKIINDFGAPKVIVKSDQGPAIKDMQNGIRKQLRMECNELNYK